MRFSSIAFIIVVAVGSAVWSRVWVSRENAEIRKLLSTVANVTSRLDMVVAENRQLCASLDSRETERRVAEEELMRKVAEAVAANKVPSPGTVSLAPLRAQINEISQLLTLILRSLGVIDVATSSSARPETKRANRP